MSSELQARIDRERSRLRARFLNGGSLPWQQGALEDWLGLLMRRLEAIEDLAGDTRGPDGRRGGGGSELGPQRERGESSLERTRLLDIAAQHFAAAGDELFDRLVADANAIGKTFFEGVRPRAVCAIEAGLSDPHGCGRSVVIVTFDGNRRVVYKPRPLQLARWFFALCQPLGDALGLPLHTRALLLRKHYGYEAHVASADCESDTEVARYYTRAGVLLRLFEVLGGADLHAENVRACGEHPVLLDLETALCARTVAPPGPASAGRRVWEQRRDSVLAVGLLPEWSFEQNGDQRTEARDRSGLSVAPTLCGQAVDARTYHSTLLTGYMRAADALQRFDLMPALDAASTLPLRHVHRQTGFYTGLLAASLTPSARAHVGGREGFIRAQLGDGPLVQEELAALLRLDVPLFIGSLGDARVRELCGSRQVAVLEDARIDAILARSLRAPAISLVESALASGPRARATPGVPPSVPPPRATAADVAAWDRRDGEAFALRCIHAAREIADLIIDCAQDGAGPALAWLGFVREPATDTRTLHQLPPDLQSGTAGIAVTLAQVFHATGNRVYAQAARRALQPSLRRLEALARGAHTAEVAEVADGAQASGGHGGGDGRAEIDVDPTRGVYAWALAADTCGRLLDAPELCALAASHPRGALPEPDGDPRQLADALLRRRLDAGRYMPSGWGADVHNLSAVDGLCAAARLFLRAADALEHEHEREHERADA